MKAKDDFKDFESMPEDSVPPFQSRLRSSILKELDPSWMRIASKVLGVHVFASLITLSLCRQFGVRIFFDGPGLMESFMKLGYLGCMAACGALYVGATFLLIPLLLTYDESRKFQKHLYLQPLLVGGISLAFLGGVGEIFSLSVGAIWLASGWLSGSLAFLFGQKISKAFQY